MTGILISNYKKFLLIFEVFGHLFVLPGVVTETKKMTKVKSKTAKIKEKKKAKDKNKKRINYENKEVNKIHSPPKTMARTTEIMNSPINSAAPNMFTAQSERSLPPNTEEGKIEIGNIKPFDISIHFPDNPPKNILSSPKISLSARNNSLSPKSYFSPKSVYFSPKIQSSFLESQLESKIPSVTIPFRKCSLEKGKVSPSLKKNSFMFTDIAEPKNGVGVRYWEYIKFQLKNFFRIQLSLKESYMLEAQNKFKQEMDVLKILEKLKEVEKLKTIVFDPVQSSAFDIFARQKINLQLRREYKHDDAKSVLIKFSKDHGRTPTELDQRLLRSLGIRPKTNFQNHV